MADAVRVVRRAQLDVRAYTDTVEGTRWVEALQRHIDGLSKWHFAKQADKDRAAREGVPETPRAGREGPYPGWASLAPYELGPDCVAHFRWAACSLSFLRELNKTHNQVARDADVTDGITRAMLVGDAWGSLQKRRDFTLELWTQRLRQLGSLEVLVTKLDQGGEPWASGGTTVACYRLGANGHVRTTAPSPPAA